MSTVDFATVKERVSIIDACEKLGISGLQVKNGQLRGSCPLCQSEDTRKFVITPAKNLWYSFCCAIGGDQLKLVAEVKKVSIREAAIYLLGEETSKPHVPQEQGRSQPATPGLKALEYLESDHEAVFALGLNPVLAKSLGIGFAPKGIAKGNVLFPIRDEHGTLHGYIGTEELTFLPKDFQLAENVVAFKKGA